MNKEKYITVSKEFLEIYKNFNVYSQVESLKKTFKKGIIIDVDFSSGFFSEGNPITIENYKPFAEELRLISSLQEDKEVTDIDLLSIAQSTDEKYIDTTKIKDGSGQDLPKPLTDEEATVLRRDIHINNLFQ